MSKKGKAPKAPDYKGLATQDAAAQKAAAQDITQANRPNQVDAYGNTINWNKDDKGNWTQTASLNPQFKAGNDAAYTGFYNSMDSVNKQGDFQAPDTLGYSNNQFSNTAGGIGNFDRSQGDHVANDYFASAMSRTLPQQQRDKSALDVQLRQQGLQPGTQAYDRAMQDTLRAQGDVNTKAAYDATGAGYAEARNIYNTNLGGQNQRFNQLDTTFGNNLSANKQKQEEQAQRYSQALSTYGVPISRASGIQGLANGLPGGQFAGFAGATNYDPANMTNAAQSGYNAGMDKYNAKSAGKNNMLGSATTLGAAAMMSDEVLKENVTPISGESALSKILALGGYTYDWKDGSGPDSGVLAQEVEKVLPELVVRVTSGHLAVKYTELMALAIEAIKYLSSRLVAV